MVSAQLEARRVEIDILGGFSIRDPAGAPVDISSRKSRALMAALALWPWETATRAQLADLLWSDRDDESARSNLRQALAVLRRELREAAPGLLVVSGDTIALDREQVRVDAIEFQRLTLIGDASSLQRAADLYGGDLLAGFDVRVPAFENWLAANRTKLKDAAVRALDGLAALQTGAARIATLRRLVALDMLREASHRALMRAYAGEGEHGLALRQFDICRRMLQEEFAARPAPETQGIADSLAQGVAAPIVVPSPVRNHGDVGEAPSIAVLPLANLAGDPAQQSICYGLAEDIVTELVRYRSLFVLGSFSSFSAHDLVSDVGSAFERLKTKYLVTGSYRKTGEEVRIGIQLLASGSGRAVWADRFHGAAEDLATFQSETVRRIVAHVESHVARQENARIAMSPAPRDWRTYDLVLRGRYALYHYETGEAETYLRQAIAIDPQSSHAHAWLAMLLIVQTWKRGDKGLSDTARLHANLAVRSDPDNALAHCAMGYVRQYSGELEAAGPHYERAMALNPNDTRILTYTGMWWTFMGEPGKALEFMDRALDREPYPSPGVWGMRANALYQLADYRETLACIDRMTSLSAWDRPYAVATLARMDDTESGRRLRTTYRLMLLREFDLLTHHAAYEPYRLREHSEHLLDGLRLGRELIQQV